MILEFLGVDLISNIANDIAGSLDRLGTRFDRLGALGDASFRQQVAAGAVANREMRVQLLAMSEAERLNAVALREARKLRADATAYYGGLEAAALLELERIKESIGMRDQLGRWVSQEERIKNIEGYQAQIAAMRETQLADMRLTEQQTADAAIRTRDSNAVTRNRLSNEKLQREAALETERVQVESHQRLIQSLSRLGQVTAMMGVAAIAGAAAIGAGMLAATHQAANFQAQMTLIETQAGAPRKGDIVGGVVQTSGEIEKIQQRVLNLLPLFGVTGDEAAKAMYHVESLGFRGDRAMEILTAGLRGAKLGLASVEDTTNVLGTVMASGISGIKNAADAMAQLDAFVGVGNMRMQDLNDAFRSGIIGAAQNFGVSLKDVGAGLATLTDLGMPAALAGTRLRMSMTLLGAPANAAAKILGTLGLTEQEATAETTTMWKELEAAGVHVTKIGEVMRTQGLIPALQLMKDTMSEAGLNADEQAAVISRAFGGGRSGAAIMSLLENMDRLRLRYNDISRLQGTFEERWKQTTETMQFKMDQLHGAFHKFVIELGLVFMPTVLTWISGITNLIDKLGTWIDQNGRLLASLAPVLMMILGGVGVFLLVAGGAFIATAAFTALGVVALPLIGAILAVIAVVAVLSTHWKEVVGIWNKDIKPMWDDLVNVVSAAWKGFELGYTVFLPKFMAAFKPLSDAISEQGGWWDQIKKAFGDWVTELKHFVESTEFASILAWLAVYLPADIKVAVLSLIEFIDVLVLAGRQVIALSKAKDEFSKGHWAAAWKIETDAIAQFNKDKEKLVKDDNALTLAEADATSSALEKKYNDMVLQIRTAINDAMDPLPKATKKSTDQVQAVLDDAVQPARRSGHTIGASYTEAETTAIEQGVVDGKIRVEKAMHDLAISGTDGIVQGHEDGKVRVIQAQQDLITAGLAATKGIAAANGRSIGGDISSGVASGIAANQEVINRAMAKAMVEAEGAGRTAAGAQSPAKRFADNLGVPIAQGVALGIITGTPSTTKAMTALVNTAAGIAAKSRSYGTSGQLMPVSGSSQSGQTAQAQDLTLKFEIPITINGREIQREIRTVLPTEINRMMQT